MKSLSEKDVLFATMKPAEPHEAGEILAFIESLEDPHLLGRQLEDYRRGAENGLLFVLRLPQGQIIGASGVFEMPLTAAEGQAPDYWELGGTGVEKGKKNASRSYTGFGLQELFTFLRLASLSLEGDPASGPTIASIIAPDNSTSLANIRSVGFTPWDWNLVPASAWIACKGCLNEKNFAPPRLCCSDPLYIPTERLGAALLKTFEEVVPAARPTIEELNGEQELAAPRVVRVNKKDGSGLSIELDHFILRSAHMLMALAQVCGKTELWGLPVNP
jgi:hypothetical protein